MGILDDLRASLKKGLDVARERGEIGISAARLRLEIAGLNRERDGLYARLGRLYYQDRGDHLALEPLVAEIDRVAAEITAREESLQALNQPEDTEAATEAAAALSPDAVPELPATAAPNPPLAPHSSTEPPAPPATSPLASGGTAATVPGAAPPAVTPPAATSVVEDEPDDQRPA